MSKRYIPLEGKIGIRKDNLSGNFQAIKKIGGKSYTKTFKSLKEALAWRHTYNPKFEHLNATKTSIELPKYPSITTAQISLNGRDNGTSFEKAWDKYKKFSFPHLEKSSIEKKNGIAGRFFTAHLKSLAMSQLNPEVIDEHLLKQRESASTKRCNFNKELGELKTFCEWYKNVIDFTFINPVIMKRHSALGKIKPNVERKKKLSIEELKQFFNNIESDLYKDLAVFQFFIGGRVQESAGIQISSIDVKNRSILIKDVVVWGSDKRFVCLKPKPKNGKVRYCYLNDLLKEIVVRRMGLKHPHSEYLFHIEGKPLGYRQIQYHYRRALNKAGLDNVVTSHFLRHSAATLARGILGSLDFSMAITGHKSITQCEEYAALPEIKNREAVLAIESALFS
ncbi:MAG: site-specific integrase [Oligoflexia bacterium]|nr:site-specific integrase [Oligoflexia bacterium]